MILGSIAQDDRADSAIATNIVHIADFSNEVYTSAGVSVTAADVVGAASVAIDAGGDGLMFNDDYYDEAVLDGGFAAALVSGYFTVIMEFEMLTGTDAPAPFTIKSAADFSYFFETFVNSIGRLYVEETTTGGSREIDTSIDDPGVVGAGPHRIALARSRSRIVYSLDGDAAVSVDTDLAIAGADGAAIGGYPGGGVYDYFNVRYFEVRETVLADAQLVALAYVAPNTEGQGTAIGVGTAAAVSNISEAQGTAAGTGTAAAVSGNSDAQGTAIGIATALGVSNVGDAVGTAAGVATAAAVGGSGAVTYSTLDPATTSNTTLSGGNLTADHDNTTTGGARGAHAKNSGKYYFEVLVTVFQGQDSYGICTAGATYANVVSNGSQGGYIYATGAAWSNNSNTGVDIGGPANGVILCFAVDLDNEKWWARVNGGDWCGNAASHNPVTTTGGFSLSNYTGTTLMPVVGYGNNATSLSTFNLGATAFTHTVPSGFTSGWPT